MKNDNENDDHEDENDIGDDELDEEEENDVLIKVFSHIFYSQMLALL